MNAPKPVLSERILVILSERILVILSERILVILSERTQSAESKDEGSGRQRVLLRVLDAEAYLINRLLH
jgi:hypothetical protein